MLSPSRQPLRKRLRITALALLVPALAAGAALATGGRARAEGSEADQAEANERCAIRLSIALVGKSADATLLASPSPQSAVDAMVATPEFAERYARFINSEFNGGPAPSATEDPVYYLAKHVITEKKPWSELFVGQYEVAPASPTATTMTVTPNPNGLGFYRTASWRRRYAGNEDQGYMLVGAFRLLSDTTGLQLVASVGAPGEDRTATGRQAAACKSCHFDQWYALDTFAKLLPRKRVAADGAVTFAAPTEGPQNVLGKTLADDKALVATLVDSDAWRFNQCRLVFKYLYGRAENQCEAKVFDACVDALSSAKTISAAVAVVAKDASFCQ